jgi:hypothetical protein
VAQLYPQALGTHFTYLLRHAWVTVGLFFNPGHHTGRLSAAYVNCEALAPADYRSDFSHNCCDGEVAARSRRYVL